MNANRIGTSTWSNPSSEEIYRQQWPQQPDLRAQYEDGQQCGGCSYFAPFNADWGLCCRAESPHHLETVFEHFTCASYEHEGWGPHSFTKDASFKCRCGGESSEYWDNLVKVLAEQESKSRRPS